MAYKTFDESTINSTQSSHKEYITLQINGSPITVPDSSFITESTITRDGSDLLLTTTTSTLKIKGYYNAETAPDILAPDGASLTPTLVNSFSTSPARFANTETFMSDASHVGAVNEISGDATVTRLSGETLKITTGTKIYQGDIVETGSNGAVNIVFQDDTKFAISEDARLAIDEYVYDPTTDAGTTNFSILKGIFVYTSGLIGRKDPDDVNIETPIGSIGIRGTIIAGDVNSGEITVVEGAIVLNDFNGNEITLANQFETAKFGGENGGIKYMGELTANDVAGRFKNVSNVAPDLFSSINDAAQDIQQETGEAKTEKDESVQKQEDQNAQSEQEENTNSGENNSKSADTQEQAPDKEQKSEPQEINAKEEVSSENTSNADTQKLQKQQKADQTTKNLEQDAGQAIGAEALTLSLGINEGTLQIPSKGQTSLSLKSKNTPKAIRTKFKPSQKNEDNQEDSTPNDFKIKNTPTSLTENTDYAAGQTIGTIQSTNGDISTLKLDSLSAQKFNVVKIDSKTWELQLKTAENFNFENTETRTIRYVATIENANDGTTTYNGFLSPDIVDIDEPIEHEFVHTQQISETDSNTIAKYQFGLDFTDPENKDITFSLGSITAKIDIDSNGTFYSNIFTNETTLGIDLNGNNTLQSDINGSEINTITNLSQLTNYLNTTQGSGIDGNTSNAGWDFNSSTGELTLYFQDSPFYHDLILDVDIKASDGNTTHNITKTYTIEAKKSTSNYTLDNNNSDFITIKNSNHFINTGNDNDQIILKSQNSTNNIIRGGDGNDILTVENNASKNHLFGEAGQDTFNITKGADNKYFGGEDHDIFNLTLKHDGELTHLINSIESSSTARIHGGEGNDTIKLIEDAGSVPHNTLDFTKINDTMFRNIEKIDLTDNANYTIKLTTNDIFEMTNDKNEITIHGDDGDTIYLDDQGKKFSLKDQSQEKNTYTNGDITLIIDNTIIVQGDLAGIATP